MLKTSPVYRLYLFDFIKSLIVAMLSASLTTLYNFLTTWIVLGREQMTAVRTTWIAAWLWYLIKNFFTDNKKDLETEI